MSSNRVAALERALTILNCFNADQPALSLKQLAERTGFYKSTILRLSASLERFGYLTRGEQGNFQLGPALISLGDIARQGIDSSTIVRPVLKELRDRFNESVAFYVRAGSQRICLYRANARRAIRHQLEEGQRLPLDRGAAGRILLAYTGAADGLSVQIRRQGWYLSRGERDPEVASLGVPVLNPEKRILGVLCLSGPLSRFTEERRHLFLPALQEQAGELGRRLDHHPLLDLHRITG